MTEPQLTKSRLILELAERQPQLKIKDVDLAVRALLSQMTSALSSGGRIEVRGFGSFSLHYRPRRVGRNPKSGAPVQLSAKHVPHFKPGRLLRVRVDNHGKGQAES